MSVVLVSIQGVHFTGTPFAQNLVDTMRLEFFTFILLPFLALAVQSEQMPMSNNILEYTPQTHRPTLADLLTIETSASIFYSYAREIELSRIFEDESMKTTVFVPTNKAVMALARKP